MVAKQTDIPRKGERAETFALHVQRGNALSGAEEEHCVKQAAYGFLQHAKEQFYLGKLVEDRGSLLGHGWLAGGRG